MDWPFPLFGLSIKSAHDIELAPGVMFDASHVSVCACGRACVCVCMCGVWLCGCACERESAHAPVVGHHLELLSGVLMCACSMSGLIVCVCCVCVCCVCVRCRVLQLQRLGCLHLPEQFRCTSASMHLYTVDRCVCACVCVCVCVCVRVCMCMCVSGVMLPELIWVVDSAHATYHYPPILPTAYYLLPAAYCVLPYYLLPTTYYLLPPAYYCLLPSTLK